MTAKKTLFCIFVIPLLLSLTACGGKDDSGSDNNEVLLWHYFTSGGGEAVENVVKKFNEEHDDIHVKAEYVPFDEMKKQLSVGAAGDSLPDIIAFDSVDNASLADQGVLANITDKVNEWGDIDEFIEGPLESTKYEDNNYGVPLTSNALGLFYNKDLLEEADISDPPETWEEVMEDSEKLKEEGITPFGMAGSKTEQTTFHFYSLLRSANGDYTDLNSEEAKRALDFETDMYKKGYMDKNILNSDQDDINTQFGAGEVAMMINGPWNLVELDEDYPDVDYDIARIPKDKEFASVLGGENMAITEDANEDNAWEFLKFSTQPEQINKFNETDNKLPPREDALDEADYIEENSHLKEFVPLMDIADPRGPSPNWSKDSETIQGAIQASLSGEKSPEEALKEAADKIEE